MVRYFLPLGLLAGISVLGFAVLPLQMGGLVSFIVVLAGIVLDRSVRGQGVVPRGPSARWHTVVSGVVYIGALVLAATVGRGELIWVAGIAAIGVLLVLLAGSWVSVRDQRPVGEEGVRR
jgi:hypothetical protein